MKLIIDIDKDEYEIFKRDCINNGWRKTIEKTKPLQEELEEIKAKIENYNDYYLMEDDYYDGVRFGLQLGYLEVEKAIKE